MLDHVSFAVNDFSEGIKFYDETLGVLGIKRVMTFEAEGRQVAGYGQAEKTFFWISENKDPNNQELIGKARGVHIAFTAPSTKSIDEWYKRCLALGGKDNGAPGPRPYYHPGYYGAFIVDPDGWRIEAAFHAYKM